MNRDEWLAKRRETMPDGGPRVQASELPTILWGDQLSLYLDKIGQGEDFDSLLLQRGRRWEAVVAEEYAQQTGRFLTDPGAFVIQQHPTIPWLGATLDRVVRWELFAVHEIAPFEVRLGPVTEMSSAPLQIKVAMGRAREWEAGPPLPVLTQVQAEIACFGSSWGAIAALTNYFAPLQVFDVERDDEFLALALPHVEEFRDRVRDRRPPEPRSSDALPALRRLYGTGNGETIELDQSGQALVVEWERALEAEDSAKEWASECRARLLALMAGASWAKLPDGSTLVQKKHGNGLTLKREWWRRR